MARSAEAPRRRARPARRDKGWLGQSLWLREIAAGEEGAPPPVDLAAERRNGDFVRGADPRGLVAACHDVSDGGLLVAVAEMAMAGGVGATLDPRRAACRACLLVRRGPGPLRARRGRRAPARWRRPRPPACRPGARRTGGGPTWLTGPGSSISVASCGPPTRLAAAPDGGEAALKTRTAMAMAAEIEALIKEALPDARSPSRTWPATATTTPRPSCRRPSRARVARPAAPDGLCRAAGPHGRRAARPGPADLRPD
jgi:hypothetical protein